MEVPIIWFCYPYRITNICCGAWYKAAASPQNFQQSCRAASTPLKRAMTPRIGSQRIEHHTLLSLIEEAFECIVVIDFLSCRLPTVALIAWQGTAH